MSREGTREYWYWQPAYDTRVAIRETPVQICTRVAMTNTRVQYTTCCRKSRVCTRVAYRQSRVQQLTYEKVKWQAIWIMNVFHNIPIYNILGNLQSINVCVPTSEVSALGWRSVIWVDNRIPLMCEVRGKWWPKYIIIFNLWELKCPR